MKNSYLLVNTEDTLYLAFGGDETKLVDELLGLKSGCCGGKGGSPMIMILKRKLLGTAV